MLEKTEKTIKNGQFRETSNIGDTRHKTKTNITNKNRNTENQKDEQQQNIGYKYTQTYTKTSPLIVINGKKHQINCLL